MLRNFALYMSFLTESDSFLGRQQHFRDKNNVPDLPVLAAIYGNKLIKYALNLSFKRGGRSNTLIIICNKNCNNSTSVRRPADIVKVKFLL